MTRKITWHDAEESAVDDVEVSRATTKFGSYTVIGTTVSTNTSYSDSSGNKSHWYKIRFSDGTNFSDYSEPITGKELVRLCTVAEVKELLDTTGRWTDDNVFDVINEIEEFIYLEMGKPIQASYCAVGKIDGTVQRRYYVGEEGVYRIDRVFYGTTSKKEAYLDDAFRSNPQYGMIEILPVASSGITLLTDWDMEFHYVPGIFNKLAIYRTIVQLLEQHDAISGGAASKELAVMQGRLAQVESVIMNKYCMQASTAFAGYDKTYGVNRKRVVQDHYRNRFIGSTGW